MTLGPVPSAGWPERVIRALTLAALVAALVVDLPPTESDGRFVADLGGLVAAGPVETQVVHAAGWASRMVSGGASLYRHLATISAARRGARRFGDLT